MKISQEGINLIKKYEGCRLTAYRCPAGVWTIGYGHTQNVSRGDTISEYQATEFLLQDLAKVESYINKMGVQLKQRQYDALCSWMFNLGIGNFNSSTLRKRILSRAGDIAIGDEFVKWVFANGKSLLGLKRRRVDEANMWVGENAYYIDISGNIKRINV